ncbi:NEDD8 ultimate buster 1-like [Coccinella septempunctata]|uniref:NEDD8 ultimate buster 1-like n=1 Tax=Coccinella septempunctata TaxID=41139 RepID=UPI001D091474|nr:NEDD8 ultimate buster 1-like [Coccinella septempunctata]XP_044749964.1 NEDD8 ultimate buster 1-like [Coccinella septempunctata]
MFFDLKKEDVLMQVREKLRDDKIKLWLDPYYDQTKGPVNDELKRLAESFSASLKIDLDSCLEVLTELQESSLENLKQNTRYKESGLATLKIKVLHHQSPPKIIRKELLLTLKASDLKSLIMQDITVPDNGLKLISSGKVLADNESLLNQGVKHGNMILAIVVGDSQNEMKESEDQIKELEGIKSDSRLLASDDKYIELEDQFGNIVRMPPAEKEALVIAMTLQKKGEVAMKKGDYSRALVMFLEADQEYKQCNSKWLAAVDNYGLLDLDIAWCYLCLQSVSNLPDAQERLKRCEEVFNRTYGRNFERVNAVKGYSGNEEALVMRLHLLQAVLLYHQNKRNEALRMFHVTEHELNGLKIDEHSIVHLLELGYTLDESKRALRATKGNVGQSVQYITDMKEQEKRVKAKALLDKERKKLGLCADGKQYVEPNYLEILVDMGYDREAARIALQKNNNIITNSVQYIQDNPMPGPSASGHSDVVVQHDLEDIVESLLPQLVAVGFTAEMATLALYKHGGNIYKAAEDLLNNNGIIDAESAGINLEEVARKKAKTEESDENDPKNEAYNRLVTDMNVEEDLDLSLQQEEQMLKMFLELLQK